MSHENNTCWDCANRIGEECAIDGREVYPDTEACASYEEDEDKRR